MCVVVVTGNQWLPSSFCEACIATLLERQWAIYEDSLGKATCKVDYITQSLVHKNCPRPNALSILGRYHLLNLLSERVKWLWNVLLRLVAFLACAAPMHHVRGQSRQQCNERRVEVQHSGVVRLSRKNDLTVTSEAFSPLSRWANLV